MTKNNNTPILIGAVIVVVILIAAAYLLTSAPSTPSSTTTAPATTVSAVTTATETVQNVTTSILSNLSTAIAPNLANCDGYNYSINTASYSSTGSCGWIRGLMNITVSAGSYSNVTLDFVQQNVTIAPYNFTFSVSGCSTKVDVASVPTGNYKVTLSTSAASTCTPAGSATIRIAKA